VGRENDEIDAVDAVNGEVRFHPGRIRGAFPRIS